MTKAEATLRYQNRDVLLNACVGFERYKKIFGDIPHTVLDIGAHIGGLTLQAMEQGTSYILAIEADKQNYTHLCENVNRQKKRLEYDGYAGCLHKAFCDTNDKIIELIAPQEYVGNSVQRSLFYSKSAKNVKKNYTIKHVSTINIDGVTKILDSHEIGIIDLFKIDIEGAEFTAMPMNGKTKDFFSRIKYLDIELHPWTNSNYFDTELFYKKHKEFNRIESIVFQYFKFLRDCGFYMPENILSTEHEYLKLTTYNKSLVEVKENAVCV